SARGSGRGSRLLDIPRVPACQGRPVRIPEGFQLFKQGRSYEACHVSQTLQEEPCQNEQGDARRGKVSWPMRGARFKARTMALLLVALVAGAAAWLEVDTAHAQSGVWRFGAVLVLSGDGAVYGRSQREGLELARDTLNEAGGINGLPVEIIFEDSRG